MDKRNLFGKVLVRSDVLANNNSIYRIKLMIQHPMESGYRLNKYGKKIERNIIKKVKCLYEDLVVFNATLFPGVSKNPFFEFCIVKKQSNTIKVISEDENGFRILIKKNFF